MSVQLSLAAVRDRKTTWLWRQIAHDEHMDFSIDLLNFGHFHSPCQCIAMIPTMHVINV